MSWVKDSVQQGLYVRDRGGKKSWVVRARVKGGKPITYTIGGIDLFTPVEARREAREALIQLAKGTNPNEELKRQKALEHARSLSLAAAINEYISLASWKPSTEAEARRTLERNFSSWMERPISSITPDECLKRFLAIKERIRANHDSRLRSGKKLKDKNNEVGLGEAQRAFRYLGAVLNSYTQERVGDMFLMPYGNPCDILKIKKQRKALKPRERFLDFDQRVALDEFIGSINAPGYMGTVTSTEAGLVWLLIHTGLRLDEARLLTWDMVDLETGLFTIENTKNGRRHTLPMTERVSKLLNNLKCESRSRWVFPSPLDPSCPISASRTFQKFSREIEFEFTAHDLRRTVATVATECGYDLEAVGSILNHSKKGVTARYTQRTHTRVREILQQIEANLFSSEDN